MPSFIPIKNDFTKIIKKNKNYHRWESNEGTHTFDHMTSPLDHFFFHEMKWNAKYMLSASNIFFCSVLYPSFSKKKLNIYVCVYFFFFEGICVYI